MSMNAAPVIIVTGASRGLGFCIAEWLAAWGSKLCLVARNSERLETAAEKLAQSGPLPLALTADVASWKASSDVIGRTLDHFGRIDAVVNNAGIVQPLAPIAQADPREWLYNIQVNLLGPFYLIRAALKELRAHRGRVINVSSGAARLPIQAGSAYCASKAGLTHLTSVLASEEPAVISVAVRPGVVDTDMQVLLREQGPRAMPFEQASYYKSLKEEGRLEDPRVPARSIAWLALKAPSHWSGRFLDYDDPEVAGPAKALFEEPAQ